MTVHAVDDPSPALAWQDEIGLADGRRLAFTSIGRPTGFPVLYFHGAIGTSLLAAREFRTALARGNLRIVMVHRPGFAGSSPCRRRTVAGFAADVESLTRRLGFESFAIVGVSAGGPYALACAAQLDEHLIAVAVASCIPPPGRYWARLAPMSGALRALACASGHPRGGPIAEDFATYTAEWRFDLGQISTPVSIWHGAEDPIAPLRFAESFAEAVPGSELIRLRGEGHFFFRRRVEEILEPILAKARPRQPAPVSPASRQPYRLAGRG